MLYVISHDLREPLRAIRNFSSLVVEREYEQLNDSSKDMLNRVVRGAERLDQLLADVLTLSRAQRAEPATGMVSSNRIVKEALSDLQATIDQTSADIEVQGDLPELKVDAFWLRQAVHNLLSNALKFTKPDDANGSHPTLSRRFIRSRAKRQARTPKTIGRLGFWIVGPALKSISVKEFSDSSNVESAVTSPEPVRV